MSEERTPLRRNEYFAIKYLFAINASAEMVLDSFDRRFKGMKRLRGEMKRIMTMSQQIADALLLTVPQNQLDILVQEMRRTEFYVCSKSVTKHDNDAVDYVTITRRNLSRVIAYVMHSECEMCDKSGKEARRCKVSSLLRELCVYDTPGTMQDGTCFYNLYQPNYSDDPLDRLEQWEGEQS